MPTRPDHTTVERTFRALLTDHGLREPDEVAHWRDSVLFGWSDTKAIVVVDLDEVDDLASLDPRAGLAVPPLDTTAGEPEVLH